MDKTDEKILQLMKGNARISYRELGDVLGMSRVAAKKRVNKLEQAGIIRGYNTYICREDEITLLIDIQVAPGKAESVLAYLSTQTADIRQIFRTTKENHIHVVAVSDSIETLKHLIKMIQTECGDEIEHLQSHAVKEVIKDVYGGIRYEQKSESDDDGHHESAKRSDP